MEEVQTKRCPQCGALLFADMDVCYDCLYEFATVEERRSDGGWVAEAVPLEAYPEQLETILESGDPDEVGTSFDAGASSVSGWLLRMSTDSVDVAIPVPYGGLIIGRGRTCDVVLHARSISRQHVHVEPDEDGAFVRDLGARNPPKLNGVPLHGEAHMAAGDTLSLCGATFVLARSDGWHTGG